MLKKQLLALGLGIGLMSILMVLPVFNNNAEAQNETRLSGFAWSSNIGWIQTSGNWASGVSFDPATKNFTGYAWSSNIGWIHFSPTSGFPSAPNHGVRLEAGKLIGWARALSYGGGWDGWIKMSDTNHGVTVNPATGALSGFAWGDTVVGWVEFDGVTCPNCGEIVNPPNKYDLNVTLNGAGTGKVEVINNNVTCNKPNANPVNCPLNGITSGTVITLKPTAYSGSTFGSFSGTYSCGSNYCVTMNSNKTVTGSFNDDTSNGGDDNILTVKIVGFGQVVGQNISGTSVTVNCLNAESECAYAGIADFTQIKLNAIPNAGYKLKSWSQAGCTSASSCTFAMMTDKKVTVTFEANDGGNLNNFTFSFSGCDSFDTSGRCRLTMNCDTGGLNCGTQDAYTEAMEINLENNEEMPIIFNFLDAGSLPNGFKFVKCDDGNTTDNCSVITDSYTSSTKFFVRIMRDVNASRLGGTSVVLRVQEQTTPSRLFKDFTFRFIPRSGSGQ